MLNGKKVRLRSYHKEDIAVATEYFNDPEVLLNLKTGIPYPLTLQQEENWYESQKEIKDIYNFAIESLADHKFIGGCGVNNFDWKNGVATIGIFIGHPDYRGQGYGTDAMKVLLDFIFNMTNVNKVLLHVFSFNERAVKSYLKNGFVEEGRLRQNIFRFGQYHDEIIMGLLRDEYENL